MYCMHLFFSFVKLNAFDFDFLSCAIKLDDYVIVTGGNPWVSTVSKYDKNIKYI